MRVWRFLVLGPLLAVCAAIFWSDIRPQPTWIQYTAGSAALLGAAAALLGGERKTALFGLLLCLLPAISPSALSLFIVAWCGAAIFRDLVSPHPAPIRRKALDQAGILFVLGYFGQAAYAVCRETDFILLQSIVRAGGYRAAIEYLRSTFQFWNDVPVFLALAVAGAVIASERAGLLRTDASRRSLRIGLIAGVLAAIATLLLQLGEVLPEVSMNRSAFWRLVSRYPASFTDPNSFGIMGFLLGAYLVCPDRRQLSKTLIAVSRITGGLLLLALPWSGSRTAWLGIGLFVLLGLPLSGAANRLHWSARSRRAALLAFSAAALLVVSLVVPSVNAAILALPLPPAFDRMIENLRWDRWYAGVSSRAIFGRIALSVFAGDPLFGVGLNGFYDAQAGVGDRLGFALGQWRDNANNLYLQVLAEGGLAGFMLLAAALLLYVRAVRAETSLRRDPERRTAAKLLALMLVLFLTGPHLFFEEVRVFLALLIGLACRDRSAPGGEAEFEQLDSNVSADSETGALPLRCFGVVAAIGISAFAAGCMLASSHRSFSGLYGEETTSEGKLRWTGSDALFALCAPVQALSVNAARPDLGNKPLAVTLTRLRQGERLPAGAVTLSAPGWQQLPIDPRVHSTAKAGSPEWYLLHVDSVSGPGDRGGADPRWLGVQLRIEPQFCIASGEASERSGRPFEVGRRTRHVRASLSSGATDKSE